MNLDPKTVKQAVFRAADMLSGMGYTGTHGSFHLLDLNLQKNTITAILHNLIAWQVSQLDPRWTFHPKGGKTPDLTDKKGDRIQVKCTSNARIKGNFVSVGRGYFVAVKYSKVEERDVWAVKINEILMGELEEGDWDRKERTQWAFLKPEAEAKLQRVYP